MTHSTTLSSPTIHGQLLAHAQQYLGLTSDYLELVKPGLCFGLAAATALYHAEKRFQHFLLALRHIQQPGNSLLARELIERCFFLQSREIQSSVSGAYLYHQEFRYARLIGARDIVPTYLQLPSEILTRTLSQRGPVQPTTIIVKIASHAIAFACHQQAWYVIDSLANTPQRITGTPIMVQYGLYREATMSVCAVNAPFLNPPPHQSTFDWFITPPWEEILLGKKTQTCKTCETEKTGRFYADGQCAKCRNTTTQTCTTCKIKKTGLFSADGQCANCHKKKKQTCTTCKIKKTGRLYPGCQCQSCHNTKTQTCKTCNTEKTGQFSADGQCANCHKRKTQTCTTCNTEKTGRFSADGQCQNCYKKWRKEQGKAPSKPRMKASPPLTTSPLPICSTPGCQNPIAATGLLCCDSCIQQQQQKAAAIALLQLKGATAFAAAAAPSLSMLAQKHASDAGDSSPKRVKIKEEPIEERYSNDHQFDFSQYLDFSIAFPIREGLRATSANKDTALYNNIKHALSKWVVRDGSRPFFITPQYKYDIESLMYVFQIPDSDTRPGLRGQSGIKSKIPIQPNTVLGIYVGKIYSSKAAEVNPAMTSSPTISAYYFDIHGQIQENPYALCVDARDCGNWTALFNAYTTYDSSMHPAVPSQNCAFIKVVYKGFPFIMVCAIADIRANAELLVDYGRQYWQAIKERTSAYLSAGTEGNPVFVD